MKIENDKYYTPINIAKYMFAKMSELCPKGFKRIIEPSCGNGSFFHSSMKPTIAFDIKPECSEPFVVTGDYLKQDLKYEEGTLVIGNPPYGDRLSLAIKFFKKSAEIADYIAFVLPISQLDTNQMMYEFDLVYSEDLGEQDYSGRKLQCCFNVYKRPAKGVLNSKPVNSVPDITIYRQDCKGYKEKPFDVRMCYWGNGSAGKILSEGEHYSGEYKIKINRHDLYDDIYRVLTTFDWKSHVKGIAMKRIKQYNIIDVLRGEIKGFGESPNALMIPKRRS